MSKFERKFSKYAIPNLSLILVICYIIGYFIQLLDTLFGRGVLLGLICLDPYAILHGQIWRLITWVLIPPGGFSFWIVITLFFYYSIGRTLENTWGDYYYNVYIFSGLLFTILGSFLLVGYFFVFKHVSGDVLATLSRTIGTNFFSTYYVNMSIFLAFAATYPDNTVLLMLFIPVKMKWLGIGYAAIIGYNMIFQSGYERLAIIMSLLNFIVFFITSRNKMKGTPISRVKAAQRRAKFNSEVHMATSGISKHKCAICGRTEKDDPNLQFRFCSKCNGNYEYCSEHLFTHKHVE
ncbi:MAG: hypothetical protein MJ123_11015 [Lachnospiraceae bacterium]|nr:hypothetical protein [Lachnospiraceae bacterium]